MTYLQLFLIHTKDPSYKALILQRLFIKSIFFSFLCRLSGLRDKKTDFRLQASFERDLALILQGDFQNLSSVKGCSRQGRGVGRRRKGAFNSTQLCSFHQAVLNALNRWFRYQHLQVCKTKIPNDLLPSKKHQQIHLVLCSVEKAWACWFSFGKQMCLLDTNPKSLKCH